MGLGSFMAAIRRLESGSFEGNYAAHGRWVKGDRAQGAYQIMSKNWSSWSQQAGISGANPWDPGAQDRVAAYKMQQYYNKYRSWWRVALAWYAGAGTVEKYTMNYRSSNDIKTASLRDYVQKIERYMGEAASQGWDQVVRGVMGNIQQPAIPPYVAPDMAAVRYPHAPQPDPRGYYSPEQVRAGMSPYASNSYNQMFGMVQALAAMIGGQDRVDIDEYRGTGIEPESQAVTTGEVMSRDVSDITLEDEEMV